ncbi:uncharacterized protein LOC124259552 isoform X1 [Haliotis rubra]|uniref:uncharacterized protein LOC124259552 isoform X1 n=2 Tax=Haliotis rubra TaxID=36100 RepID=UPI001EE4F754|nr:uncharacterized protein LOC124259552 isoform X1 [Haliotis rubra]
MASEQITGCQQQVIVSISTSWRPYNFCSHFAHQLNAAFPYLRGLWAMSAVSTPVLLSAVLLMLVVWPDVSLGWGSNSPSRSRLLQLQRLRLSRSDYPDDDDDGVDDDYPSHRRSSWRRTPLWDRGTPKPSTRRTFNTVDTDDDDYPSYSRNSWRRTPLWDRGTPKPSTRRTFNTVDTDDDDYPSYSRNSWRRTPLWDRGTPKPSTRRTFNTVDTDDDDSQEDYSQYRHRAFSRLRQVRDDYYRNRKGGSGGSEDYNDDTQSSGQRRAIWGGRQANDRGMSGLYARLLKYLQSKKQ